MKIKDFQTESWSQKYKNSINCSHPKGFSQKAHCAGKKKHNESIEMEMVCEDCGMCQTHGNVNEIAKGAKDANGYTRCWPGKHAEGTKKGKNGGQVRNCVPNESVEEAMFAPKEPRKFDPESAEFVITMDGKPHMTVKGHSKAMDALKILAQQQSNHKWGVQSGKKSTVAEGTQRVDSLVTDALKIMRGPELTDAVQALKTVLGDREFSSRRGHYNFYIRQMLDMYGQQGVAEDYNGEYDDEAGMADNNLGTLRKAVDGIDELIQTGDNLPEWCQEKIAVAENMLVTVWNYMQGEQESEEDPEVEEMYEAMNQLAEEMAAKNGTTSDLVWESFEALPDNILYETAAWHRKAGKNKNGGLNRKGVMSYRREHPGSKLQTAVTTKPSKLKPGSKAAKRRKSFCARMSGVKGPMKKPNGKPTRKALALRKWNC
jgi:hypothetical protein